MGERRECSDFGSVATEEGDGFDAGGVERVVDVAGEVVEDGGGWESDAGGPLSDEGVDVGLAVDAGVIEVVDELVGGDLLKSLGASGPDGGDPGEAGAGAPFVGEVDPGAGADGGLDVGSGFEGEEGWVADEECGVGMLEHGDGVGGVLQEGGIGADEFAEEDFGVGEGTAGGGVGGDGLDGVQCMRRFENELDGADVVERGDGAAGHDSEGRREGSDGNEAEIGAAAEEIFGALRGLGVVKDVALGKPGVAGRVLEVPHERGGIEELDGGDADEM